MQQSSGMMQDALKMIRQKSNPAATDDSGTEVFLDAGMFDKKPQVGQPITVKGTVTVTGNKIGISPTMASIDPEGLTGNEVPQDEIPVDTKQSV